MGERGRWTRQQGSEGEVCPVVGELGQAVTGWGGGVGSSVGELGQA